MSALVKTRKSNRNLRKSHKGSTPTHTHTLDPSCVIVMTAELGAGCEELTPVLAEVVAQTGADSVLWNNLGWDRRQPGNTIPFLISLEYQWMLAL